MQRTRKRKAKAAAELLNGREMKPIGEATNTYTYYNAFTLHMGLCQTTKSQFKLKLGQITKTTT